jgi:hypothetical protein
MNDLDEARSDIALADLEIKRLNGIIKAHTDELRRVEHDRAVAYDVVAKHAASDAKHAGYHNVPDDDDTDGED